MTNSADNVSEPSGEPSGTKPVSQPRSARTRDALVSALERLLKKQDFDRISVSQIAAEAGVAVGTVYRRFENKEAFIPALLDAYCKRLEAAFDDPKAYAEANPLRAIDPASGLSLRDALGQVAMQTWESLTSEAGLMRTLYLYSRIKPEVIGDGWEEIEMQSLAQMEALLEAYSAEIKKSDKRQAAIFVTTLMNSVFIDKALFPEEGAVWLQEIDGEALARETADAACAYLTSQR